jgi:lysophospholipase L1-like esterase
MTKNMLKRLITYTVLAIFIVTSICTGASFAAPASRNGVYVALGDSVPAGDGLAFSASPTSTDIGCGLSPQAYPATLAHAINMPYADAACSGATIDNLSVAQSVNGNMVRPQLDIAFSYGTPSLISVTVGANDAHWDQLITTCFISTCGGAAQTKLASSYFAAVQTKLHNQLQQISTRSHGNPPLTLVTAYYNPISNSCTKLTSNITPAEVSWISSESTQLNKAIQNSTTGLSFTRYVPVSFQGHGICDANTWVQTFADSAPFHPNVTGQNGIAYVTLIARNQAIATGIN